MRCLKNGRSGDVVNICSRSNSYSSNNRCQGIRNIISIKIKGSHYRVFIRSGKYLLQKCIGYYIFDDYFVPVPFNDLPPVGAQVDDRQPAMGERTRPVRPQARVVGAAMDHRVAHRQGELDEPVAAEAGAAVKYPRDAAHERLFPGWSW